MVRERVAEERSVRYLVPSGVREIIVREKLYLSE
jgi:nicotinic acid mononucleotide adenylyltransferase